MRIFCLWGHQNVNVYFHEGELLHRPHTLTIFGLIWCIRARSNHHPFFPTFFFPSLQYWYGNIGTLLLSSDLSHRPHSWGTSWSPPTVDMFGHFRVFSLCAFITPAHRYCTHANGGRSPALREDKVSLLDLSGSFACIWVMASLCRSTERGTYTVVISLCVQVFCGKCVWLGSLSYLLIPIVLTDWARRMGNLSQKHLLSLWTPGHKRPVNMGHCMQPCCIEGLRVFHFLLCQILLSTRTLDTR